jgi:hypothetical protein
VQFDRVKTISIAGLVVWLIVNLLVNLTYVEIGLLEITDTESLVLRFWTDVATAGLVVFAVAGITYGLSFRKEYI